MNIKLDNEEFKITSLIIKNSIAHAAQSLSKLLKDEVKLYKLNLITYQEYQEVNPTLKHEEGCYILSTAIFGEFNALSHLIITEEEAEKIWKITQPENISMQQEMQEAILLEMDNILTAAVVSEIANILQVNVFGGVPSLKKVSCTEVFQEITPKEDNYQHQFVLNTVFLCKMTQINPSFIWFFQPELLHHIQNIVNHPEKYPGISKIKDFYVD